MGLRQMAMGILAVTMTAGIAGAGVSRDFEDSRSCRFLVSAIERKLQIIDDYSDRIREMSRMGTEQDRERVNIAIDKFQGMREAARGEYERNTGSFDLTNEDDIEKICDAARPKLEEVNSRLDGIIKAAFSEEAAIRTSMAGNRRVGLFIQRTDKMLFRAAQIAKKTDNGSESFPQLRRAFELQETAKQALAANKLEKAMKISLKARDLTGETIREALDSSDLADIRSRIENNLYKGTNEMIARIERNLDENANPRAANLLEMARQEQKKAKDLAEEQPYKALRHAQTARRIVTEMLQFNRRAQNCETRIEVLSERIENAEEAVEASGNEKAAEILEKGISHYENGKEMCQKGDAAKATVQFDIALKMTAKSVDVAKGETRRELALAKEIKKTMVIVRKAESVSETDKQKTRVEDAKQLVQKAENLTGNPNECLKLLDKATDIAFSVISESKRSESGESVDPEGK